MAANPKRGGRFHIEWRYPIPVTENDAVDYSTMNYKELQDAAKAMGLETAGKKVELVARIEAAVGEPEPVGDVVSIPTLTKLAEEIDRAIDLVDRHAPRADLGETKLIVIDDAPYWRIRWVSTLALADRLSRIDPRFRRLTPSDL